MSAWLRDVAAEASGPDKVLALFDALGEWFAEPAFRGCALVNGAIEARGIESEARAIAAQHLERHLDLLRALTGDAEELARRLLVLVEGATTVAFVRGDPGAAADAKAIAARLLAYGPVPLDGTFRRCGSVLGGWALFAAVLAWLVLTTWA